MQKTNDNELSSSKIQSGNFTAGVAVEGDGEAKVENGDLVYQINGIHAAKQTKLVTENRAVAAAFINQGTDLISDSLDALSRDDSYGIKTFAAVQGNRSKYDVNSDIKINGWSTIVGAGNADKFSGGDEFGLGRYFTKTAAAITVPIMNLTTSFSAATAALYIMAAVLPQGMKMLTVFIPKAACAQAC